jgi:RNA polymerase sigma-70 factor (ECF subfamily)
MPSECSEAVSAPLRLRPGYGLSHNPREEDHELVGHLKARDERAFETMVHRYTNQMLATARRVLGSEHDAQDAVQQAFISVFRAIPGFNAEARLSTWLHKIVVNAALAQLRSRHRRVPELLLEHLRTECDALDEQAGGSSWVTHGGEQAMADQETREMVRTCIDQLPESYRAVLFLRDIQELDTAEVAKRLAISPNAIKIRLHRGRQVLKTLVRQEQTRTY